MSNKTILLEKITCTATGDHQNDGDELYFIWKSNDSKKNKRYPDSGAHSTMVKGDEWLLNYRITFSDWLRIDLYDKDSGLTNNDDFLGSHTYYATDNLNTEVTFNERDGHYVLKTVLEETSRQEAPQPNLETV